MKKKICTKIAASFASLALLAGGLTAPAGSFFSMAAPETALTASAWDSYATYTDSTGTFTVRLDSCYVKNGKSNATKAQIYGVTSSKITKGKTFVIPREVTVSGKDFNNQSFTVTVPVTEIGVNAFHDEKNLNLVSIPNTVKKIGNDAFSNCGLASLTIPSSVESFGTGAFRNCDGLYSVNWNNTMFRPDVFTECDHLAYINNQQIITYNPKTGQPILHSKVWEYLRQTDAGYSNLKKVPILNAYITAEVNYIVRTQTITTDSDIVKARKLHDWLTDHVVYDYDLYHSTSTTAAHEAWGPFLHQKGDGKFYAVCAGYAGAYKLLMDAAGVECHVAAGPPFTGIYGHEWNVVKIAGNYYHVDTTWDDRPTKYYGYFMRSDAVFSDHEYKWMVADLDKTYQTGIAAYDLYQLGDVNKDGKFTSADSAMIQKASVHLITLTPEQKMRADVNLDGTINIADVVVLNGAINQMGSSYKKTFFEYKYIYQ